MLAHAPEQVSVAALVAAVDGPISLADCLDGPSGICELESFCSVRGPWQKISDAIRVALEEVSLADMAQAAASAGSVPARAQTAGREHAS